MDRNEIWEIAMRQSAMDMNCAAGDFLKERNQLVISAPHPQARCYLSLPFYCDLVTYGSNIVASVSPEAEHAVREYMDRFPLEHCFETPALYTLNSAFACQQRQICFMAEYFLPDPELLTPLDCAYEIRILDPADFQDCYLDQWSNALCAARKERDVLAAAAFDQKEMIGIAGCSADCSSMWQIGVDVLPRYRRQHVASALTSRLALEILERGKVPFYCAAWSNIRSVRNALRSGFRPAWAEVTAQSIQFTEKLLRHNERRNG